MPPYPPAGSCWSTRSTRLTDSKYWLQSRVEHRRRLVITFATDTWAAAWPWCSLRIASSDVMCWAARCSSIAVRTAARRGPYSRMRCRTWTTKAV
jgi:hypothetical protein